MGDRQTKSVAFYALTKQGAALARRLHQAVDGSDLFLPTRLAVSDSDEKPFHRVAEVLAENFMAYRGHVIFAATGIVVRSIAPLIRHKTQDPAVVVCDQAGQYCISLLSGHLGGGNQLARAMAKILGGKPVITTATDLAGLPSLEMLAMQLGMGAENIQALAKVSGDLLEGKPVGVWDPAGWLLPELEQWRERFVRMDELPDANLDRRPLVWVGWEKLDPPPHWLVIRPPCLVLGLGCRRDTGMDKIEKLVRQTFKDNNLHLPCLARLASVDAKQNEEGILQFARKLNLETIFYSQNDLNSVEVPNPSEKVQEKMGVESVCEAAAILTCRAGRLLVEKTKSDKVTCAVALAAPAAACTL